MSLFVISESDLVSLWKRSNYPIPDKGEMVIFGMRGIRPTEFGGTDIGPSQTALFLEEDYKTMRCSLGIWVVGKGLALFPGSTIPFGAEVKKRIEKDGKGVNQIGRGRYKKYIKGMHASGKFPTGHRALLQRCNIIVQRTMDDADFDSDDEWEKGRAAMGMSHVGDNIHCARNMGSDSVGIPNTDYASLGCSVVAGTVLPNASNDIQERGPWAKFIDLVYDNPQNAFEYVVWGGNEVLSMCTSGASGKTALLRFGSHGKHVKKLQRKLTELGLYSAGIDGDFGYNSFVAVHGVQMDHGIEPDGVVGKETADAIGFDLPMITANRSSR